MEISRRGLYERVWSTPILKLCEEFWLSDRGLAKLCARHNVPRPPRGYWAKTQAGHATKRTSLFLAAVLLSGVTQHNMLSVCPPGFTDQRLIHTGGSCAGPTSNESWVSLLPPSGL